jgi:hypothetical protein
MQGACQKLCPLEIDSMQYQGDGQRQPGLLLTLLAPSLSFSVIIATLVAGVEELLSWFRQPRKQF